MINLYGGIILKMGDSRSRNVSQARSSVNGATGNRPAGTQAGSSGGRPGPKRISRKQREMRRKRQQLMAVSLILVLLIVILIAVLIKSCGNKKPQTDNVTTPAVSQPETQNEQGNASQSDGENNNQDNGQNNSGNSVQEKEYTGEDGKLHKVIGTTEKGYTIEEVDGVTYVDGVLIANKTYPLPEDFIPTNPEVPVTEGRSTKSLDKDLMTAWRQLQADAAEKLETETEGQKEEFTNLGLSLPDSVMEGILEKTSGAADTFLEESGIYTQLAEGLANFVIEGISFMGALILAWLLLHIISELLGIVSHIPILKGINRFLGIFAGAIQGFLFVWIAFYVIALCSTGEIGKGLVSYIYESSFLTFLYENNLVLAVILNIF